MPRETLAERRITSLPNEGHNTSIKKPDEIRLFFLFESKGAIGQLESFRELSSFADDHEHSVVKVDQMLSQLKSLAQVASEHMLGTMRDSETLKICR